MKCPMCDSEMKFDLEYKTYTCENKKCYAMYKLRPEDENVKKITIDMIFKDYTELSESLKDGCILKDLEDILEYGKKNGKSVDTYLYYVRLLLSKYSDCCYAPVEQGWSGNYFDEARPYCTNCGRYLD